MLSHNEMCHENKLLLLLLIFFVRCVNSHAYRDSNPRDATDISLWIDENEVSRFASFPMEIFVIMDGMILPYIVDPNFESYLPEIPSVLNIVNFTWASGDINEYLYEFYNLKSFDENILQDPMISINKKGKVPRKPRVFSVILSCRNRSGVASFEIGLKIENSRLRTLLPGFPLRLRLRKVCLEHGPDPECHSKCANGGHCNSQGVCECPKGYIGKYCLTALCYPQCQHGGQCVSPGYCECKDGYNGPYCEGGMCTERCLNMGKCFNKDICHCTRGYYGKRCEYSKCKIPCLNRGRCIGLNKCKCKKGFFGTQCEIASDIVVKAEVCKKKCVHGICVKKRCSCDSGWFGNKCNRRRPKRQRQRKLH